MSRIQVASLVAPLLSCFCSAASPPASQEAAALVETFAGRVLLPGGEPAAGAVVVTNAGGQAVAAADGGFALAVELPREVDGVRITAVAAAPSGSAGSFLGSVRVAPLARRGANDAGRIVLAATVGCEPSWLPTFGTLGVDSTILAATVYDDGSGPALVVGGEFLHAGGIAMNRIAAWNGHAWKALGDGITGQWGYAVRALAVFDDGSGAALYAGGNFKTFGGAPADDIARWNGVSWSAVGSGTSGTVNALLVFDDGGGPALYAAGLGHAGGLAVGGIARWDGSAWSGLGGGTGFDTYALAAFDDGAGPALFAGGRFTSAGGVVVNGVAKWDGLSWSALGGGVSGSLGVFSFPIVEALAVFDDGGGPALYAGGSFTTAGGIPAANIARWNGTTWSALGSGVEAAGAVRSLAAFDDGTGPALYAGGHFSTAGGVPVSHCARWNGTSWSAAGSGVSGGTATVGGTSGSIAALTAFDGGGGAALFAGGLFDVAGEVGAGNLASWSAVGWSAVGSGLNGDVRALTSFDDGTGPALYAGGDFKHAGGLEVNGIAKWDGQSWSALGGGLAGSPGPAVHALAIFDDGGGAALHAGGFFYGGVARWDGTSWSALGSRPGMYVHSLLVFDDGSGPALYAGGYGDQGIARWDGASWSSVGGGVDGIVRALGAFDDGGGMALYAGGQFATAGGVPASFIARWDGLSWSPVGGGVDNYVEDFAVFNDGGGARLFAGGVFATAGGVATGGIASWDGASWSAVGGGTGWSIHALKVHNDGSGRALYAGGDGAVIGRWDGTTWSEVGKGVNGGVFSLASHDAGGGLALYAGGNFTASAAGDSHLAQWGCAAITSQPGCAGNLATLEALASGAPLGAQLSLRVTGFAATNGSAQVYFGRSGLDAGGCGLVAPGIGELLLALAPEPTLAAAGALAGGVCYVNPPVPALPALSGITGHLQAFAIDLSLASPIEPTNALAVLLGP
jgi:hypothetical protein